MYVFDRVPEAVYADNQDMLGEVFVDCVDTVGAWWCITVVVVIM